MLNLNQKRSLGITLGIMEDELKRLKGVLQGGEEKSLFSHVEDDLTPEKKNLILEKIDLLTEHMVSLKSLFDLRHSQKEFVMSAMVKATALYLSVELDDVHSHQLKGYGEVHPGLKDFLDPKLDEMSALLRQMESIA
jgi:hypothetical protein